MSSQICPFLAVRPQFHSIHRVNLSTPRYCQSATFGRLTFCVYHFAFTGMDNLFVQPVSSRLFRRISLTHSVRERVRDVIRTIVVRRDTECVNLTTNLAECVCMCVFVCVCAKCDLFLPVRSHFFFKLPEFFFRIAKFPYAAFGPPFAFHCPIFFTKNNTLNGVCMLNVTAAH